MRVRDVLQEKNRRPILIEPDATVREAVQRLNMYNIGSLPVVDSTGRLVGIFTERDVLHGVAADCSQFVQARVGDVMTPDPACCGLDDEIHDVMGLLSERRIGQLPVLDQAGSVVGVVSVGDLVRILYDRAESENRQLLAYIYGPVS
ncbi:MAG: signal transduction protein [Isosphaeraceae bacterium]|jgi:CBS domain-containing protein|nr:MAG: signal transduction protein [Isosphaeraceae bacterium]